MSKNRLQSQSAPKLFSMAQVRQNNSRNQGQNQQLSNVDNSTQNVKNNITKGEDSQGPVPKQLLSGDTRISPELKHQQHYKIQHQTSHSVLSQEFHATVNSNASDRLKARMFALAEQQSLFPAVGANIFKNQPSQGNLETESMQNFQKQQPGAQHLSKTEKRRKQHKLISEQQFPFIPKEQLNLSQTPVQNNNYKYFSDLFGTENQKALLKSLEKTLSQANKTMLPPTLASLEFKLAVIRKQQLRKDIKDGKVQLKLEKKNQVLLTRRSQSQNQDISKSGQNQTENQQIPKPPSPKKNPRDKYQVTPAVCELEVITEVVPKMQRTTSNQSIIKQLGDNRLLANRNLGQLQLNVQSNEENDTGIIGKLKHFKTTVVQDKQINQQQEQIQQQQRRVTFQTNEEAEENEEDLILLDTIKKRVEQKQDEGPELKQSKTVASKLMMNMFTKSITLQSEQLQSQKPPEETPKLKGYQLPIDEKNKLRVNVRKKQRQNFRDMLQNARMKAE